MHAFPLFQNLRKRHYTTRDIGFQVGTATINRVHARYRLARSYQGMRLDGYGQPTAEAYSQLFHLFLTYSTFEQFLTLYGIRFHELEAHFIDHPYAEVSGVIRQADSNGRLLDFLCNELDNNLHKTRLRAFGAGQHNNLVVIAAALRHVFVHGKLGPNSNRVNPSSISQISVHLIEFLLHVMDVEFSRTLHTFCTENGIPFDEGGLL